MKSLATSPQNKQQLYKIRLLSVSGGITATIIGLTILIIGISLLTTNTSNNNSNLIAGIILLLLGIVEFVKVLIFANNIILIPKIYQNSKKISLLFRNCIFLIVLFNFVFGGLILRSTKRMKLQ